MKANEYKTCIEQMNENYNSMKEMSDGWRKAYNDVLNVLVRFNKLPWYKKMFYKFNV